MALPCALPWRVGSCCGGPVVAAPTFIRDLTGVSLDSSTRLAGAKGIEHAVSAGMVHFEGETIEGNAAKELLIRLASQPDG